MKENYRPIAMTLTRFCTNELLLSIILIACFTRIKNMIPSVLPWTHVNSDVQRRRTIGPKNRRMLEKFLFFKMINYLRDETIESSKLKKRLSNAIYQKTLIPSRQKFDQFFLCAFFEYKSIESIESIEIPTDGSSFSLVQREPNFRRGILRRLPVSTRNRLKVDAGITKYH